MHQGKNRARRERDVAETEPDVDQHADRRNRNRHNRIALHLLADRTGDTVGCDLLFIHTKLIRQRLV